MTLAHMPVLLREALSHLSVRDGGIYVDCTFGAGGYSRTILRSAKCKLYALDKDISVSVFADTLRTQFNSRFYFMHGDFANLGIILNDVGVSYVDGIVFDIGLSSMQLDNANRGFSFMQDGPLDMRMDIGQTNDASYIVNRYTEKQLANVIFRYGGERKSKQIARAIVQYRNKQCITSTKQLASIVKQAVGCYRDDIHPATRTFQAIRILVNQELEHLQKGLIAAATALNFGGTMAVVTFHSLEDAIVKRYFSALCERKVKKNKYQYYSRQRCETEQCKFINIIKNGHIVPQSEEVALNPRARSAKLRAIRRVLV